MAVQTADNPTNPTDGTVDLRPRRRAELPGVRPPGPARTGLRLRRVFRPSRSPTTSPPTTPRSLRKRIEAGPANIWRYAPAAARPGRRRRPSRTSTPASPSWSRPTTSPASWASPAGCRSRTTPATRTHSFKDRVVADGPRGRPRLRLHHPVLLLHRQPRRCASAPPPPAPASAPACSSRTTWSRARSSRPRSTAASWSRIEGNYDDVNRFCSS